MSRELTLIEKMGVEFEERDGLFYPLVERAIVVNEEAYELLCAMEEKLLGESDIGKSFAEIYALRTQVRMLVEEIVMREIVNVFH